MMPATRAAAARRATASLFLATGHVYVYRAYGISMMLNISSEREGVGAGVLIRALEPMSGIEVMRQRRGLDDIYRLTKGPGRLTQALAIDLSLDGTFYEAGNGLWLGDDGFGAPRHTPLGPHRHHPQPRPTLAVLRARQSLGQWAGAAQPSHQ